MHRNSLKKTLPLARPRPTLRFSPSAWAQFLYLRDLGDTEIGGFGIAAAGDLLFVDEFAIVRQTCTASHVAFDDGSVADFFDAQVDRGRRPEQFGRIWLHTHPGNSARPSPTDEATFARVFGRTDWAVMGILARGGATYARLRYHVGPGAECEIPVAVDYRQAFAASDFARWQSEYRANVRVAPPKVMRTRSLRSLADDVLFAADDWPAAWDEYADFDQKGAPHGDHVHV